MAEQLAGRLNEWLQHVQILINSSGPAPPPPKKKILKILTVNTHYDMSWQNHCLVHMNMWILR